MSQSIKQVTVLVVLCIMLKQSFAFFPHLYWGIKVYGELSMLEMLSCPPDTLPCLCVSFLSLFFLYNISNPHTHTLE